MRKMGVFAEIAIKTIYQMNLKLQDPQRNTYLRLVHDLYSREKNYKNCKNPELSVNFK